MLHLGIRSVVLAAVMLPSTQDAYAEQGYRFDLCKTAEVISIARVTSVESRHTGAWLLPSGRTPIESRVTFESLGYITGDAVPTFDVVVLGGEVGGLGMQVAGAPIFREGQVYAVPLALQVADLPHSPGGWKVIGGYLPIDADATVPASSVMRLAWEELCRLNPDGIPKGGIGFGGTSDVGREDSAGLSGTASGDGRQDAQDRQASRVQSTAPTGGSQSPWLLPESVSAVGPPQVVSVERIEYRPRSRAPRVTVDGSTYRVPAVLPYDATGTRLPAWWVDALVASGVVRLVRGGQPRPAGPLHQEGTREPQ
jgi:hypothetical protein